MRKANEIYKVGQVIARHLPERIGKFGEILAPKTVTITITKIIGDRIYNEYGGFFHLTSQENIDIIA